ncbi:MAG: hypothetical protein U5L00_14425 [Desulfovermiculus sp.]|nr:hypothetical protein [Desulfovermiculus sp.]
MAFFRMPGSFGSGFLVGLGAVTLVPLAARVLSGAGKPLLKEVIKGGMIAVDKSKALYAEAQSSISQATSEAQAEASAGAEKSAQTGGTSAKNESSSTGN